MSKKETALDRCLTFFLEAEGKTLTPKEIEKKLPKRKATGVVWELKERGHKIEQVKEKGKIVSYTLVSVAKNTPKPEEKKPAAKEKPKAAVKAPAKKVAKPAAAKPAPVAKPKKVAAAKAKDPTVKEEAVKAEAYTPPKLSEETMDAATSLTVYNEPKPEPEKKKELKAVAPDSDMPEFLRRI